MWDSLSRLSVEDRLESRSHGAPQFTPERSRAAHAAAKHTGDGVRLTGFELWNDAAFARSPEEISLPPLSQITATTAKRSAAQPVSRGR